MIDKEWLEYFVEKSIWNKVPNIEKLYKQATVFPLADNIFRAFNECSLNDVSVVILGQDPYPNVYKGIPSACGLCFATENGYINPSLRIIFKELNNSYYKCTKGEDLCKWPSQGVLMLNTTLTVEQGKPNSHMKLWDSFTKELITNISTDKPDLVWLLMGNNAQEHIKNIKKGYIVKVSHPMTDIYGGKNKFVGSNCFVKVNELLNNMNKNSIIW